MSRIPPAVRRYGGTVVKWAFAAAVLVAGYLYVSSKWAQVSHAFSTVDPLLIVLAVVFVVIALIFSMLSWLVVWPAFQVRLPVLQGARVFFVSQIGKYLPGSVWPIAAQAQMAKEVGLSRSSSIVLSLISMLVSIAVGLAMGSLIAPFINPHLLHDYWWLALVGIALVCCLIPRVMRFGVRLALRLLRRPEAAFDYTGGVALRAALLQAANWLFAGLQLWVILIGLGLDPWTSLLPSIAAMPLAFCLGILLIPFPAGLGVREFVITLVLSTVTTPDIAVTAAIMSRIVYAFCDFALAGVGLLLARRLRATEVAVDATTTSAR
jgi:hypothetical protein